MTSIGEMINMKLTKKQKDKLEIILAWRDFAMACDKKRRENVKKSTIKLIEEILK